jgi:hypothetical protein
VTAVSEKPRATGKDIILAIAENMQSSLEPLVTKTLAPSLYQVYLYADDYERLRTIFGEIEAEAKAMLDRELAKLNRDASPLAGRLLAAVRRKGKSKDAAAAEGKAPQFVSAEGRWFVRFQEDPNGVLGPGDVQVVSEFAQAPATGYGAGNPTVRISTTHRMGGAMTSRREATDPAQAFARIAYRDDAGEKVFWVTKDEIVIGREAPDVWVDLRLVASFDVSREHARLRRSAETGAFRIKDLSKLGTTVNGTPVPQSLDIQGEVSRDLDLWADLPDRARIGLAGMIFLDFERTGKS